MSKILIIEDNVLMREAIRQTLKRDGHEILGASDGPTGISLARAEKPDLILLDLMMPFMNGQEVARYLRYDEELADIPIVVITAVNQVDTVLDMLSMKNVRDYFLKPIDITALRDRVRTVLENPEPARDAEHNGAAPVAPPDNGSKGG
jgi:DNA-binding response OmpR family regulator